jgi:hypothetical protein
VGLLAAGLALGVGCRDVTRSVPLKTLVSSQAEYEGQLVETQGTLRSFTERGDAYWVIEDADGHRMGVRSTQTASFHPGERVQVTGTFHFDPREGRFIAATRITSLGEGEDT